MVRAPLSNRYEFAPRQVVTELGTCSNASTKSVKPKKWHQLVTIAISRAIGFLTSASGDPYFVTELVGSKIEVGTLPLLQAVPPQSGILYKVASYAIRYLKDLSVYILGRAV